MLKNKKTKGSRLGRKDEGVDLEINFHTASIFIFFTFRVTLRQRKLALRMSFTWGGGLSLPCFEMELEEAISL